jgi:hypothetical protein
MPAGSASYSTVYRSSRGIAVTPIAGTTENTQDLITAPAFPCSPDRVSGIPSCLGSLPFVGDNPIARFHEKENPGMPPRLFATLNYRRDPSFGLEWLSVRDGEPAAAL